MLTTLQRVKDPKLIFSPDTEHVQREDGGIVGQPVSSITFVKLYNKLPLLLRLPIEKMLSRYFQFYGYLSQQQNMMQDFVRWRPIFTKMLIL